jgi:rubrerythrin
VESEQVIPSKEPEKQVAVEHKTASYSDEDLEEMIAKRREERQQKSAGFCPKCGKPILQTDLFCPSCGRVVN